MTTWHYPHLPAAAAAAIDRYLLPAGPTAANLQQRVRWLDGTDRHTDRKTPDSCIDLAPHTMRAMPIKQVVFIIIIIVDIFRVA